MSRFNLEDIRPQAWLLLSFGEEREYAGNLGYADELSKVYQYDSFVPNHLQISKSDLALLRDKSRLLGVARIERIEVCKGTKERLHCPACNLAKLKRRKIYQPEFRCYNCGNEFDTPVRKLIACTLFTANFGASFVLAKEAISIKALRHACPKYNKQLAMQPLDFKHIEATLLKQAPSVWQLLTTRSDSDYLKVDDAALTKFAGNSSKTGYVPTESDSRQAVMREIQVRRGQQVFRQALRSRYGDHCMITGCQLLAIIEAAHISPYRGHFDNHPENGLLLRADLHTLFDLDFIGIHPKSLKMQFHSVARSAGYHEWEGKTLLCSKARPSEAALESRWQRFLIRLQDET